MAADPSKKKATCLKIAIIVLAVLVVLVIAIFLLVSTAVSAPRKASEDFLAKLSDNQVEQAYNSASGQFKQEVSTDQFKTFLEQFPILTKVKTSNFDSINVENNSTARVSGIIATADGEVSPVELNLVNENDTWHVLNLNLNPQKFDSNPANNAKEAF